MEQCVEQCGRVAEIRCLEAIGEDADGSTQCREGLVRAMLAVPQPREAHRAAQFPRAALLASCDLDGPAKGNFRGAFVVRFREV